MQLYTLSFVFVFLPVSILLFWLCPQKLKRTVLLLLSIAFYWLLEPRLLYLMLASVLFDYIMAYFIEQLAKSDLRKLPFAASVIKSLLLIIASVVAFEIYDIAMPLGVFIYTLTSMGYIIDLYNFKVPFEKNIADYLLFCIFFGKINIGPLDNYTNLMPQIKAVKPSLNAISTGIVMFIQGLAIKVLLVDNITPMLEDIKIRDNSQQSVLSVWMLVIATVLSSYFNLLALTKMSRGISKTFSIYLPENFKFPFLATSVTDFVSRFYITVNKYIDDYLIAYLRVPNPTFFVSALYIMLANMLMGLWFGFTTNYLLWGAFLAVFVILEKYALNKYIIKMPKFFRWVYAMCIILLSFIIFAGNTPAQTVYYVATMFNLNSMPLYNNDILYLISNNYLVIIICVLTVTKLVRIIAELIVKKSRILCEVITVIVNISLLFVSAVFMR